MGLNKQKGNMYEHVTHTWNPIGGDCRHNCSYCSTQKFYYPALIKKYSGPIRLYEDELKTNFGEGKTIFVVAQHDLFASDIPNDWIERIIAQCNSWCYNKYLFQSKNPKRILDFMGKGFNQDMIDNYTFCTTIETNRFYKEHMGDTPFPRERARAIEMIGDFMFRTEVTIEPVLDFDLDLFVPLLASTGVNQINLGADSGNNHLPDPSREKLELLISSLKYFTTIKIKDNLKRLLK